MSRDPYELLVERDVQIAELAMQCDVWRELAEASYGALWALEGGRLTEQQRIAHARRIKFAFELLDSTYGVRCSAAGTRDGSQEVQPARGGRGVMMRRKFYVASRASIPERGAMWRRIRESGVKIVSTWIDEDGPGETPSMALLWMRVGREVSAATDLVLYVQRSDLPLKGALVEVGMALAAGTPVSIVCPDIDGADRTALIGSWVQHPLVQFYGTVEAACSPSRSPGESP